MEPIFHIASATDWHAAQASSEYRISTRGRTLQEEGFIHCSYADQVCRVANAFYRGMDGLVLLVIDRSRVRAEVRDETSHVLALWDDGWSSFNNCYVLVQGAEAILIDSGKAEHAPALVGALRELGLQAKNIAAIVATHGHHDHVGGASFARFASVPKHIHAADKGLLPEAAWGAWDADLPVSSRG